MNVSVLWDIVSRAKIECHEVTHEEFRFYVQVVFLHLNFLVLTLKSRCYFIYDIFAIVRMPLRCNVLEHTNEASKQRKTMPH